MKTILVDAVNAFVLNDGSIFNEMHELLEQYPNRKIILTGADDEAIEKYKLNDVPYELFTLKHNPEKTDPKYYETMLKHFNLRADDVIYFENKKDAVESARSVGINTFHYNKDTKDLIALKKFIDEGLLK